MDLRGDDETSESRFAASVEGLSSALGHADRVGPLKAYCTGLLLPGERKSIEPMAEGWRPVACRRYTSRCITSWRRRTGRMKPCSRRCGHRCLQRYRVRVRCSQHGREGACRWSAILVDCAQLAPHRGISMGALSDPSHLDYVTLSAHKMYAPFGTGALIARRDTFERGGPEYCGGGTIEFVSINEVTWTEAPDRDEAGTPNVAGAVALAAAMQALNCVGLDNIARHEAELTAYALECLAGVHGLRIYGDADPKRAAHRLGVIAFNVERAPARPRCGRARNRMIAGTVPRSRQPRRDQARGSKATIQSGPPR